ncbi:MAG: TIGR04255 family protein [Yaniella sp.]|nr:TIGR04255 family protein [Yaniella sp.]
MTQREIYPNAPISLVVAEIRHPMLSDLTSAELGDLKSAFSLTLPILRWDEHVDIDIPTGSRRVFRFPRFASRDLHHSVTVRPDALIVESMVYTGWEDFRQHVVTAMQAHDAVKPLEGIERSGLRYIDEIRLSDAYDSIDWADWVADDLIGPKSVEGVLDAPIEQSQGTAIVQVSPSISYTVRYGAARGQAVVSTDNLVRADEMRGDYFLLDLDGAWLPPQRSVPEFDIDAVTETLDELHQPIGALFESLITERLRDEVLR